MCGGVVEAPRGSGSLDAMLGSVVVFRSATGAVAEVIVPFGLAKAGLFSGCPVVLGFVGVRGGYRGRVVSCVRAKWCKNPLPGLG